MSCSWPLRRKPRDSCWKLRVTAIGPGNNIAHHVCSRHSLRGISNVRYMESLDIHLSGRLWPRLGRFIMSAFAPNPPVTLLSSSH